MYSLDLLRSGDLYNSINEADKKLSSRERRLAIQKLQTDLKKDEFGVTRLVPALVASKTRAQRNRPDIERR